MPSALSRAAIARDHRRLGRAQADGGVGEGAVVDDSEQCPELTQIQPWTFAQRMACARHAFLGCLLAVARVKSA